ncbi:MAG: hypothetical protein Q8S23_09950 [Bacteroidales bacterium]|nr:hypothetical protein [Bacteroidales bacterium]
MRKRARSSGQLFKTFAVLLMVITLLISCDPSKRKQTALVREGNQEIECLVSARDTTQDVFWSELQKLLGKAYEGTVVSAPANDTAFTGKRLLMHVLSGDDSVINIPFFVGTDSSRTWVFTKDACGILLKHDHRHQNGTPDELTMYGGKTQNFGSAFRQIFPADQETADMLPGAITNVWWIDFVPGEYFVYNLRRVNTYRLFSVRFDLTKEVETPGKPWGWS